MIDEAKIKEAQPTQLFIEIQGVKNGVLLLKNGGLRQILMVSGLNFDLKSPEEQEAITLSYQSFLNSLNFSLQIFVHSRRLNIEKYLSQLSALEMREPNPLLRNQVGEYREFIHSFVSQNAIMTKTFFVVVPFDPVILPEAGKKVTKKFFGLFSRSKPTTEQEKAAAQGVPHMDQYFTQLSQRTDQVVSGLNQIGLRAIALNDEETIELFYNLYNPESVEKREIELIQKNK